MAKRQGDVRYLQGVFDSTSQEFLGISDPNTSGDGVDFSVPVYSDAQLEAGATGVAGVNGFGRVVIQDGKLFDNVNNNAPIIKSFTYTGTGNPSILDINTKLDDDTLLLIKGEGQYACSINSQTWYGNVQKFGNEYLSGSSSATVSPSISGDVLGLSSSTSTEGIKGRDATNKSDVVYHGLMIKDNGSGILDFLQYNGYRNQTVASQGTVSNAVTMDGLALTGKAPELVHVCRDAANKYNVWATQEFAKGELATDVDNSLMTLNSDGTLSLSTSASVNENDGGIRGEATSVWAFSNSGTYWDITSYIGDGSSKKLYVNGTPAGVIVVPKTNQQMQFWFETMGDSSADGGQTNLYTNRLSCNPGIINIGTDTTVNTVGVEYTVIVFYKSEASIKAKKTISRKGIAVNTVGGGIVRCGSDASLSIAGTHSLEWIGSVSDVRTEQFLVGRMKGGRSTPTSGTFNFAMAYTADPDAGLEICTSDRFSSENTDVSKQQRWRTGIMLRPDETYHILYTYDGVDKWLLYINGVLVKWRRLPMSVFGLPEISALAGAYMVFNGRTVNNTDTYASERTTTRFCRIYNRVLTTQEAKQVFARHAIKAVIADISDSETSLVEEWKFNNLTGTTVTATKNGANNGTAVNMSWVD